jgi:hypothetical protein
VSATAPASCEDTVKDGEDRTSTHCQDLGEHGADEKMAVRTKRKDSLLLSVAPCWVNQSVLRTKAATDVLQCSACGDSAPHPATHPPKPGDTLSFPRPAPVGWVVGRPPLLLCKSPHVGYSNCPTPSRPPVLRSLGVKSHGRPVIAAHRARSPRDHREPGPHCPTWQSSTCRREPVLSRSET